MTQLYRFPMSPPEYEVRRPDDFAGGGYELRAASFPFLSTPGVWVHGRVDLRQWHAYSVDGDCELPEHEDRANREDCWRDWWKTGLDWIDPEEDDS